MNHAVLVQIPAQQLAMSFSILWLDLFALHVCMWGILCKCLDVFSSQIEDSNAGWTLGYMLNLTNMIPAEAPDTPLMPHGGFVTLVLFLTIFLLILLLLWYKFLGLPSCSSPKEVV